MSNPIPLYDFRDTTYENCILKERGREVGRCILERSRMENVPTLIKTLKDFKRRYSRDSFYISRSNKSVLKNVLYYIINGILYQLLRYKLLCLIYQRQEKEKQNQR